MDVRDAYGDTPLIVAVVTGQSDAVSLLLKYRASTEAKPWSRPIEPAAGFTFPPFYGIPLDYAAAQGNTKIAKSLLSSGAKATQRTLQVAQIQPQVLALLQTAHAR